MKTIGLAGFFPEQIVYLKKKFGNASHFIDVSTLTRNKSKLDALICITETELDKLFFTNSISNYQNLDWVHASSAGVDNYRKFLKGKDFNFTCGKIIQGPQVADHAMALLLALTRRLHWILNGIEISKTPRPTELNDKEALIIGLGGVGTLVAERCHSFGMKISTIDQQLKPLYSFISKQYLPIDLSKSLSKSDVVIITAPLTDSTENLLGYNELMNLSDDAYLINVSRGKIIDINALVKILNSGKLSGVGLDVTFPEPLPVDHPIKNFERVIITPHIAGMSTDSERRFNLIVKNIGNYLSNSPLLNLVDKNEGY